MASISNYRNGPDYKPSGRFGNWLSDNLNAAEITYEDLSYFTGISTQSISLHLTGKARPSYLTVRKYCKVFHSTLADEVYLMMLHDHYGDE